MQPVLAARTDHGMGGCGLNVFQQEITAWADGKSVRMEEGVCFLHRITVRMYFSIKTLLFPAAPAKHVLVRSAFRMMLAAGADRTGGKA